MGGTRREGCSSVFTGPSILCKLKIVMASCHRRKRSR